jgi:ArsR family transcriptional regulator, lead/cadmium/zinc/bismuth-responsive transcriptional repressor
MIVQLFYFCGEGVQMMEFPKSEEVVAKDNNTECCDVTIIHDDVVSKVQEGKLPDETIAKMANIFQAMSDPTRLKIIHSLIQSELCVCDLAAVLEMTQSAISHQLRYLNNLTLVKRRKVGRMVYYSIVDEHVLTLFENGLTHVSHR